MSSLSQTQALFPLALVAASTLVLVLADSLLMHPDNRTKGSEVGPAKGTFLTVLAALVVFIALLVSASNFGQAPRAVVTEGSMLVVDLPASFAMTLLCGGTLLTIWLSLTYLPVAKLHFGEFYTLLLFSLSGALGLVCAGNLISLFVSIELMSLPIYVLAGFDRGSSRSNRAGTNLFMSGAFASALSLYGIAMIYGATGHFDYPGIRQALDSSPSLVLGGLGLLLVGLLTRVGAVPFHAWLPDTAAGAPVVVTAFIPVTFVSASGFALIRVFDSLFPGTFPGAHDSITALAGASMLIGAVMALREANVKRMFAYAGVVHAGFLLVALSAPGVEGRSVAFLQIAVFMFMQVGALGTIASIARTGTQWERLSEFAGLAERRPILAAALTLFLLSLSGMPGTSGFVSRFSVMSFAVGSGQIVLALMIGVASVVLFAAYLRIATAMYMGKPAIGRNEPLPFLAVLAISICALVTLYLGLFPGEGPASFNFLDLVRRAAEV